ncbi:MAG: HAMP domain-containing protein [Clostridia bacterium]|nr:HAMP domain-containing protein [Clostridia bacterium]
MKNISIRMKITLWFSTILFVITGLSFAVILSVSGSVLQKTIRDSLIDTIENNVDEVEFFNTMSRVENDNDADHYIEYNGGYLEVDDDYLDLVNGISTSLCFENGELLYGENPIMKDTKDYKLTDGKIQKLSVGKVTYYIYDRMLTREGLHGLWLRGVVSEEQGSVQLSNIARISLYILPLLLVFAAFGGYIIAGKTLKPLRQIEDAASRISKGPDLKKRIELSPGTDELHQLADTFNEMFDRLDQAFESEKQFTSDVSHELRTPMSVIMAQCEFSLEKLRTPEEYETALYVIKRQGGKMNRMIEDMLSFIRLERKSDSFIKESLNLSSLVTSVCEDMALLPDQGILLTSTVEDNIFIVGNQALLSRLLTNLISNAYRYGRPNGYIKVTLSSREPNAVLTVSDNGIGIAKDQLEKIFHRFYQIESSRSGKGTGLGLAMVQEIARFHNGTVHVESQPGEGSTFTIILGPTIDFPNK